VDPARATTPQQGTQPISVTQEAHIHCRRAPVVQPHPQPLSLEPVCTPRKEQHTPSPPDHWCLSTVSNRELVCQQPPG
jgi:hypothetical protein